MLTGCSALWVPAPTSAPPDDGTPQQLLQRQIIVTLAPATAAQWEQTTESLAQTYGLPKVGAFPLASLGVQCIVFQIPAEQSLAAILATLAADPRVETVQTNQFFESQGSVPNDPYASLQYGALALRVPLVHPKSTGKGVKIAVIDTGVDVQHPDLQGRIVITENFVAGGQASFAQDRHGTAVIGVIAARANNDIGIFGVAPDAEVMALKACWHRTAASRQALCSSWTLARAVDFAIAQQARVVNFSLAGPPDALLQRLLDKAVAAGMTVVAATLQTELGFPASLESVIAVLASDTNGHVRLPVPATRARLLAAPGIDIITTLPQRAYDFLSGSSLAAAHVSGIAALLLEQNPRLSPAQLQRILQSTAHPIDTSGHDEFSQVGLVDACAALRQLLPFYVCPSS